MRAALYLCANVLLNTAKIYVYAVILETQFNLSSYIVHARKYFRDWFIVYLVRRIRYI